MRLFRIGLAAIGILACSLYAQELAGIWEGTVGGPGQQRLLRVDFDSRLFSFNGGSPAPLTLVQASNPQAVQFDLTVGGRTLRFDGQRVESRITGTAAGAPISLTRLPDDSPRLVQRKRYPLPNLAPQDAQALSSAHAFVADLLKRLEIPGLSVAVAKRGQIVWSEGFGLADVELGVPVNSLTKFRLGSVSKVLTAAAVARLVEAGKLDLDAPVQRYVPSYPAKLWPITTRQLAAHMSGIRHYESADFEGRLKGAPHFASIREGLAVFQDDKLLFEPGTNYAYSSYGWNLIGAVIEGASGQEFLSFMQSSVFEPLGLRNIAADHVDAIVANRTRFYTREAAGRPLENAPYVDNSYKWSSGGFLANAEDLVRFGSAHLQPGFFKQSTLDLMFKPVSYIPPDKQTGVGIAWRIGKDTEGRRILHHGGTIEGGRAMIMMLPDSGIVVAMLANILADFGERDAARVGSFFIPK